MNNFSKQQNYELAAIRRDQINSLNYVISGWQSLSHLYQEIDFKEDKYQKACDQLVLTLSPYFPKLKQINRLEGYDISNLGSKVFVGAMTVYQNGKIDTSQYRQFKINSKVNPDDQFMIKEIVYRRLKHPEWLYPNILMVDGGKPQVSAAHQAIELSNNSKINQIYVIGLAKKFETIVIKTVDDWVEINLPKNSPALQLLQQIRDEAHRFSNRYRKKIISNQF
ncbi:UvrABC system protein C [bioreactor metagenome]|uniref:UvrABC system protein C n=1 Tax=bioreactor metagenome TaxID=1076179 RepID=A0A645E986_9ZZZZ